MLPEPAPNTEHPGDLVSIVLPVHNQAAHIADILLGHCTALDRLQRPYELVVVTNACTDNSAEVVARVAESHPGIRLVDMTAGGWGRAVREGLSHANGASLGYANSARTTPEMLALILLYEQAYPHVVVKANRRIRDRFHRRLGSLFYNLECRALFDLATWDINGTPKLFPREFGALLALDRNDDLIDLEFMVRCRTESYPVIEVPLLETVRHGGRSTTNYRSAVRLYLGALELRKKLQTAPKGA